MNIQKKFFIIACEASGDAHATHLIRELKRMAPSATFEGLGGPQMKAAGLALLYDMTKISALGLGDVIRLYFLYRSIFYEALSAVRKNPPDALILVDSPAFNLRFAKKFRRIFPSLPIFYYICPQIWAWGQRRIHTVKKTITKMFSILPFEAEFYKKSGVDCEFVGHPLLDHEKITANSKKNFNSTSPNIGLLPGSRRDEVKRILPVMLETACLIQKEKPKAVFHLALSANVDTALYETILSRFDLKVRKFSENFNAQVASLDFALVASGTATLQTALAGTPLFLLYKTAWSTYVLGRQLIRVPYLGLVNLLAGKGIVPEFIQYQAQPHLIAKEALDLLNDTARLQEMCKAFNEIREKLGSGSASRTTAERVFGVLDRSNTPRETPDKRSACNSPA